MATKVFVSFDFDNDKTLKEFIIQQAKNADSPFEVSDLSLKEAAPERDWLAKAERAIGRADVFLIMLGSKTRNASGVLKELKIANEKGTRKFSGDWISRREGRVGCAWWRTNLSVELGQSQEALGVGRHATGRD